MPYLGEIRLFAGNYAPAGWRLCQGQLLRIAENEALFQLIGTTYGGDGATTIALPDLRGRAPIHQGPLSGRSFKLGERGGVESVRLTPAEIPTHSHQLQGVAGNPSQTSPAGALLSDTGPSRTLAYGTGAPAVPLDPGTITMAGGTQPHANVQPFQAINYIIALDGVFPGGGGGGWPDDPFVGEIRFFPYSFAPRGWAPCRGQLLPLRQHTALFSVVNNYYGGDYLRSTFALPNLQEATPIGAGQGPGLSDRQLGASGGQNWVPLNEANLPSHAHRLTASAAPGTTTSPANQLPATAPNLAIYGPAANMQPMSHAAILAQGGGEPHNNLQPYLALNPCIALQGMFPPHD